MRVWARAQAITTQQKISQSSNLEAIERYESLTSMWRRSSWTANFQSQRYFVVVCLYVVYLLSFFVFYFFFRLFFCVVLRCLSTCSNNNKYIYTIVFWFHIYISTHTLEILRKKMYHYTTNRSAFISVHWHFRKSQPKNKHTFSIISIIICGALGMGSEPVNVDTWAWLFNILSM